MNVTEKVSEVSSANERSERPSGVSVTRNVPKGWWNERAKKGPFFNGSPEIHSTQTYTVESRRNGFQQIISVIADFFEIALKINAKKLYKKTKIHTLYGRISFTLGSVIARCYCSQDSIL